MFSTVSEMVKDRNNPNAKLKTVSMETKEILFELDRDFKQAAPKEEVSKPKADKFNAVCILLLVFFILLFFFIHRYVIFIFRHIIPRVQ